MVFYYSLMSFFRRRTLFHVEERLPDQEDLRLRFRRRMLASAVLGFLLVLGFPVYRELHPELRARRETRRLAEALLESRLLAARSRAPVALRIVDRRWERSFLSPGSGCNDPSPSPVQSWESAAVSWLLKLQRANGEPVLGTQLCLHPLKGLLLGDEPVGEGTLLISAQPVVEEGQAPRRAAHLLISQYGAEIQTLSH